MSSLLARSCKHSDLLSPLCCITAGGIFCVNGFPRRDGGVFHKKIPPPMNRWGEGKAKGWQCYRMRTRMTAGMAASFSASLPSTAPVASSMV
jgi:hypothetical protein